MSEELVTTGISEAVDTEDVFESKIYMSRRDVSIVKPSTDPFISKVNGFSGVSPSIKKQSTRLQKKFEGSNGAESKQLESEVLTAYSMLDVVTPPNNVEYLAALYSVSPVFRAAVQAKVTAIVGTGFDFVESEITKSKVNDKEASEDQIALRRRKLSALKIATSERLDQCNQEYTFTETLTRFRTDVEVLGFGCIEIGRAVNGQIAYIGHIPAKSVRVRRQRDGYVQMINEKAVFFRNFGDKDTPNPIGGDQNPNELIFYTSDNYSPNESYYGIPPIVSAAQAIAGNEQSARFNLEYFENKAVPRYVFVIKGARLSDTAMQEMTEFLENLKGQNHRTLIVPLPADETDRKSSFEMKPVEAGVQDSSFMNYRRSNTQEILMAHRVPPNQMGITEGIDNSLARDLSKNFKENVTRPDQKNIERRLNRIIGEWTDGLKIKLREAALSDETELSKQDQVYVTLGVLTANDIRVNRWGMEPLENGDVPYPQQQIDAQVASDKATQAKATATQSRTRDTARAANSSDSIGEARAPKGSGRAQS